MKRTVLLRGAGVCAVILLAAAAPRAEDPWADAVLDYSPVQPVNAGFETPEKAVGPPVGAGPITPGNSSLACLGVQGGSITLKFNTPVTDDPANPMGLDAIVFGNATFSGGDPTVKWQEPALIEISEDVNGNGEADDAWYLIPGSKAHRYSPAPDHTEPTGETNASDPANIMAGVVENPNVLDADSGNDDQEYFWGYAELTPTMTRYLDNYVRPDDPFTVGITARSGGGDAFDIAWAVDQEGNPANVHQFHFVRLRAFIYRDCATLFYATPEIDAVADVAPDVDGDGDGILDEYETRVAGTDPTRPENTVLPLEIPSEEGGSPYGAFLGAAQDLSGNRIALYAAAPRTSSGRALDVVVDILAQPDPGGSLPSGWLKSGAVREFVSSVPDFVSAGIQPARITIAYGLDDVAGLDERALTPFRFAGGAYVQDGITNVSASPFKNEVMFTSTQAGVFLLGSRPGAGDQPLPGPAPLSLFVVMVFVLAHALRTRCATGGTKHV